MIREISEWGNPPEQASGILNAQYITLGGEPDELKHLSSGGRENNM